MEAHFPPIGRIIEIPLPFRAVNLYGSAFLLDSLRFARLQLNLFPQRIGIVNPSVYHSLPLNLTVKHRAVLSQPDRCTVPLGYQNLRELGRLVSLYDCQV